MRRISKEFCQYEKADRNIFLKEELDREIITLKVEELNKINNKTE